MAQGGVRRPDSVKVGPHRYAIHWDASKVNRLRGQEKDGDIQGYVQTHCLEIAIDDEGIAPTALRMYFLHEVMHAIVDAAGGWRSTAKAPMDEENAIWTFQAGLLGVLRENPDVVAWLCADEAADGEEPK